jgi:hypothetical protein
MIPGHHDDSAVDKYTNTKDGCRRLVCRIPTEKLVLQPSHSFRLLSIGDKLPSASVLIGGVAMPRTDIHWTR